MEISLALILEEMGLEADVHLPEGENPIFTTVELYVGNGQELAPDKLLVCPLSEAVAAGKLDGVCFLCVRDRMVDEREDERTMTGITVVRRNIGMRELFNRVHHVFIKFNAWVMEMESCNARRGGFQELLDLSEPVFRNFITIQDGTFKLIANTKGVAPPDPIMTQLVRHGYHPPDTMELLRRHRRVEEFLTVTEVVVSRDKLTSEYDVVKKTYHIGGSISIMVVMVCCGREANVATLELFNVFIEYIKAYADHEIAQTSSTGGVKTLALDILTKNVGSKEEARIRSAYCGFPFEGKFRLCVFSFEDESNVPIARLVQSLSDVFRDGVAFSRERKVLLIVFEPEKVEDFCDAAAKALRFDGFTCGVGNSFNCLWDLPVAYEQALIASDVSSRLKTPERRGDRERFSLFSENLVYHIVSAGCSVAPNAFENSFPARAVVLLREYDRQHRTDTMRILRLFLENERSATVVSSIMHMHRNTVLYHMEKVSDLLGVSLNDPETRLQLLLAFKADDFVKL